MSGNNRRAIDETIERVFSAFEQRGVNTNVLREELEYFAWKITEGQKQKSRQEHQDAKIAILRQAFNTNNLQQGVILDEAAETVRVKAKEILYKRL